MDEVDVAASQMIIGQFHDVIEVVARATDMQNVDEACMCTRDRFAAGHAFEFTSKAALAVERAAVNKFSCHSRSQSTSRSTMFKSGSRSMVAVLRSSSECSR